MNTLKIVTLLALVGAGFLPSIIAPNKVEAIKQAQDLRDPHFDYPSRRICYNLSNMGCGHIIFGDLYT